MRTSAAAVLVFGLFVLSLSTGSGRRHRRQVPGECLTLEGIPGSCQLPDFCRFPPAIKVRLFRSTCFSRTGQRGICCPGGSAVQQSPELATVAAASSSSPSPSSSSQRQAFIQQSEVLQQQQQQQLQPQQPQQQQRQLLQPASFPQQRTVAQLPSPQQQPDHPPDGLVLQLRSFQEPSAAAVQQQSTSNTNSRPIFRQNNNAPFSLVDISSPSSSSTSSSSAANSANPASQQQQQQQQQQRLQQQQLQQLQQQDISVNDFTSLCTGESQNCLPHQEGVIIRRPAQPPRKFPPIQVPAVSVQSPTLPDLRLPTPTFSPPPQFHQVSQIPLVTAGQQPSSIIQQQFQLDNTQVPPQVLEQISVTTPPLSPSDCPTTPVCFESKYRTFDGSCNNLKHPNWGKSFFAFPRLMEPAYADGISVPRAATDGSPLPSARLVSSSLILDANVPDNFNTNMIMAFGQFLDHDLTRTAVNKGKNNTGIACCRRAMIANPSLRHPECLHIEIPSNDPFFGQFNQTCMEFVRSLSSPRPDCTFGPREQMNQITAYIDASNLYGSTKNEVDNLRAFERGRMQVSRVNDVEMLPFVNTKPDFCSKPAEGLFCFKAGDTRVNEQISLTIVHTIWMREHNRIAGELAAINPTWSDEHVFQETRRIVGAIFQHIVYNEFLPVLLGRRTMQSADLLLLREGFTSDYDDNLNPGITNEFATAAYRFGHTLIPGNFMMFSADGQLEDVPLREVFNKPFHLFKQEGLDSTLRGLCTQRSQQFDTFITHDVTRHLFQRTRPFGLDLVAINLQRGRDHGLPGYNRWRSFCNLPTFRNFDDLRSEMNTQYVDVLRQLYRSVDDIDLFVAGVAEKPLSGAKLGSTFACIMADQFKRLKKGDRFWYENGSRSPFTAEQLQEIRKVTFARIICDNSDAIDQIQQFVFFAAARGNALMPCSGDFIPRMNLALWTDEPV